MNWKNKRVLITGGMGMIGLELYEQLADLGADVTIADLKNGDDLTDFQTCRNLCLEKDIVMHLAGVKGSPKMTKERPVDFMSPMLAFDRNMIVAAQQTNVKKFLYTSSIAVENPDSDKFPAWAKRTAEVLIEAMRIQYPDGTKYCIVRPANVYGNEDLNREDLMVVSSLIKSVLNPFNKLVLDNKGSQQTRDIIHARDVARNMIKVIEEMPDYPVNLCSGKETSIKQIAEEIAKNLNVEIEYKELNLVLGPEKKIMTQNYPVDIKVSLEDGIKECVEYARNNK